MTIESPLREIIWLEVQKNPGISAKEIEVNLGIANNTGVHSYLTEMFRARMIDRTLEWKASTNVAGRNSYYAYTVPAECKEFKWVTPGAKAKAKVAKRANAEKHQTPQALPVNPAPTREAVIKAATSSVDLILAQLPAMSLRDVLKLKAGIDEALTV